MKIAFIVYDELTLLDFAGVYDPITRLKSMGFVQGLDYDVCAEKNKVKTFEGIEIIPDQVLNDLSEYDYVFIPGGNGILKLLGNAGFMSWVKNTAETAILISVCGGSLVLGAAGYLNEKNATTHPALMQYLRKFTEKISEHRIVEDENVITARSVTSSLDLGLYICEKIAGSEVRKKIQKQMDYLAYTAE
jgi:Transcriptional regulator containing an amidase domain and an AraC-type DNA-binding HTH domain